MAEGIFDWDDEDDKGDEPVALIQYQPDPFHFQAEPPEHQHSQFGDQSVPSSYQAGSDHPWPRMNDLPGPEPRTESADQHFESFGDVPPSLQYQPVSPAETARRGGLAFSAGIVFFSSVAFMLFLGWIADLLIGSSPWGLVGGIVLGSVIGFIQFIRITSQIFNTKKAESAMRPLMLPDDEDN